MMYRFVYGHLASFSFALVLFVGLMSFNSFCYADNIVSTKGYNIIQSNSPILKVVVHEDSHLETNPIFSYDKKSVLISVPNSKDGKSIYIDIETNDGVFPLTLVPSNLVNPQTITIGGEQSVLQKGDDSNPNAFAIPIISNVILNKSPEGFRAHDNKKYQDLDYGGFIASPSKFWTNGFTDVIEYSLILKDEGATLVLDPSQFFENGVVAVSLEKKTLTHNSPVRLIIVSKRVSS